jgi:hypothetical protein
VSHNLVTGFSAPPTNDFALAACVGNDNQLFCTQHFEPLSRREAIEFY